MRKEKILWSTVLAVSVALLIGYGFWSFNYFSNINYQSYGPSYYGSNQYNKGEKLSVDQIKTDVNDYIKGYGNNLEISDIFVYKDTDYYASIEEKDTGKGAMELLVNPYSGQVYPEHGPNMMWNEKYSTGGGYGMMGNGRYNMMGDPSRYNYYNYYDNGASNKKISSDEAVKIADQYVKDKLQNDFTVLGNGHEFYGYYTFHITKSDNIAGMLSVNYYTGDVWYHDWHGVLEQVISNDNK